MGSKHKSRGKTITCVVALLFLIGIGYLFMEVGIGGSNASVARYMHIHSTATNPTQSQDALNVPIEKIAQALDPDVMAMKPTKYEENYKNPCFKDAKGQLQCLPYFYLAGSFQVGVDMVHGKLAK